MSIETYRANIIEDWERYDQTVLQICLNFLEHWAKSNIANRRYSLHEMAFIGCTPMPKNQVPVMKAIQYLSGDRAPLIVNHFEFLDGTDATDEQVREAFNSGDGERLKQIVCKWSFTQSPNDSLNEILELIGDQPFEFWVCPDCDG